MSASVAAFGILATLTGSSNFAEVLLMGSIIAVCAFLSGSLFAPLLRKSCRAPSETLGAVATGALIAVVSQFASTLVGALVLMTIHPIPEWMVSDIPKYLVQVVAGAMLLLTPLTAPSGGLLAFVLYILQTPLAAKPQMLGCGAHASALEARHE